MINAKRKIELLDVIVMKYLEKIVRETATIEEQIFVVESIKEIYTESVIEMLENKVRGKTNDKL